ncbi:armadillo-type protein [Crepidotus variabilis]|uniref:Importin-13 n=1 Tax=Crepidotus variabilis TaxID=179855 RepID=A0A9P6JRG9_9AGAR|nr:armadillo-type protein [Crepidotus variabilis]
MSATEFLPSLSQFDVERAIQLIQQAYSPTTAVVSPDEMKRLQHDLFEIQKRPEAWGLVIPLLNHDDQNVQFFGAHTAQVKIARDWDAFPQEHAGSLRDMLLQLTAHSMAIGRNKVILRKLFVAVTSLALKLAPGQPPRWPDWIVSSVTTFSNQGASTDRIHDFLTIVAEEVSNADLLGPSKAQMQQIMTDATSMVVQTITTIIAQPLGTPSAHQYNSALKCLQAWMTYLKGNHLTSIIPLLIGLLDPSIPDETIFVAASDALQELLSKSALSDGSGTRTLTEPLLVWFDVVGNRITQNALSTEDISAISHSLCKLLVALGDHSTPYLSTHIASSMPVSTGPSTPPTTKGHIVQSFLRLLLVYTGLPGYYGVDEEESEMTLGFWYLFQEALWSTDFYIEDGGDDRSPPPPDLDASGESKQVLVAKAVYTELVKVLRRKVAFPPPGSGWSRDQVDKFQVYRRDVGDTLINAYYVLRGDMVSYFVNDIAERLSARTETDGWQDIEATLHCLMSIQESMDMEKAPQMRRLFSPEILGRLPAVGRLKVRRTALGVIGVYSSWFATDDATDIDSTAGGNLLLAALSYVVSALPDPSLCLSAATSLRNLCEANRKALAVHISAFGELHAGLNTIPDSEKSKVLQSIASVIQAMPAEQEIAAIEVCFLSTLSAFTNSSLLQAIINPIIEKLYESLRTANSQPDDARTATIFHLETLAGVAKGLTRTVEGMTLLEDETDPLYQAEAEKIKEAREDPRAIALRNNIFSIVKAIAELWSQDASISQALSDLIKAITSLPSDITLITLPAAPLLELVCLASQRHLTAAWLSLTAILIAQLNPPVFSLNLKSGPTLEAEMTVQRLLPVLLQCGLSFLSGEGSMENNPDIVQEFFGCMDRIGQDFTNSFYALHQELQDALMQCAIKSLSLQERYSLISACTFMSNLINRSSLTDELIVHKINLLTRHGRSIMRAILQGFAGVAPRSAVLNLIDLLSTLLHRATGSDGDLNGGAPQWMKETLMSDDFIQSKAGPDAKAKFLKAVSGSRSLKKTRDAAQQFTLVARGLEGTNFGYSSITM